MSDRLRQARAEAERRYPGGQRRFTEANLQAAFQQGAAWADANPQPTTITRTELSRLALLAASRSSETWSYSEALALELGIEVTDDAD